MAKKFLVSLDLNKNELLNARIQNLGAAPSNPVSGQIYYDTGTNVLYFYNGTEWTPTSGSTEVIQDLIGSSVLAGTALTATYDDASGTTTLKLNDTAVTPGSFGSQTKIPTFTVDQQGRLTAAGEADVATTLTISDDTSSTIGINLLTETLEVNGGEGIDVAVSGDTLTISAEDASAFNKGVASFATTDFVVTNGNVTLNQESIQDIVGGMVSTNTESGISVTYDDANGKLDFNVADPTITLSGDVTGSATMTNLGDVTITTTVAPNSVELGTDTTGDYVANIQGTENEITVSPTSGARKYAADLSNASSLTSLVVTHNLGSDDVTVQVFETSGSKALVETDVERTSANTITLKFATAPASGAYRVVITG